MSEQNTAEESVETTEETEESVESGQEPDATEESGQEPDGEGDDWRDDFDADRAKKTIAKLREDLRKAKADKTPQDEKDRKTILSLKEQAERLPALEEKIARLDVALDLGLPKEIAQRLQGSTRDEMVADAEKLLELIAPTKRPPSNRPTEQLRGGGDPDREPDETDLSKLGERMFRR